MLLSCRELRNTLIIPCLGHFPYLRLVSSVSRRAWDCLGAQVAKTQTGGERLAPPSGPAGLEQAWGRLVPAP